jgi:hypothetical protein
LYVLYLELTFRNTGRQFSTCWHGDVGKEAKAEMNFFLTPAEILFGKALTGYELRSIIMLS